MESFRGCLESRDQFHQHLIIIRLLKVQHTGKLAHFHSYLRRILPHNRFSLPIKAANPYAPSAAKEREKGKHEGESAFRQAQTLPTKMKIRVLCWAGMAGCVGCELVLMEVLTMTFGRR
jgi:hypothetical protein